MSAGTCLRCGAPYDADDTVCYSCGAPIGETKTPTQPVRTVKMPRVTVESQPIEAEKKKKSASRPLRPSTSSATSATSVATAEAPPQPKRRKRLWLALAIVVLVIIAAGGGFYLVRGLTAAPPVASQTTYQYPQHRFSFTRPTLWSAVTTANGVQLSDSDGSNTIVIAALQPADPAQTAMSYANQQATQLGIGPAPQQEFGGETWEQRAGQVTDPTDGAVHQIVLFVTVHDGLIYTITFTSPIASYTQINNLVYQPLLASFTFEN